MGEFNQSMQHCPLVYSLVYGTQSFSRMPTALCQSHRFHSKFQRVARLLAFDILPLFQSGFKSSAKEYDFHRQAQKGCIALAAPFRSPDYF